MGIQISDSLSLRIEPIVEAKLHEFTIADSDSNHSIKPGKSIIVTLAASHWGYINNNLFYYKPESVDGSLQTWIKPYEKPVLTYHPASMDDGEPDIIGRIKKAVYTKGVAREFIEDDRIPNNRPDGYLEFTTKISDAGSMQKIIDGRYDTVSISAVAVDVECSICGKNVQADSCNHVRGSRYNDDGEKDSSGRLCYYKAGPLLGRHVAFVHMPSDSYAGVIKIEGESVSDSLILPDSATIEVASASLWVVDSKQKLLVNLHDQEGNVYERLNDVGKKTIVDMFNQGEFISDKEGDTMAKEEKVGTEETTDELDFEDIISMKDSDIEAAMDTLTEDAKLSYAERKKLPDSAFCGPDRSFPAHDAAHVRNGLARLKQSNFSDSVKRKILACLRSRAKKFGIKVSTTLSDDGSEAIINSITIVDVLLSDATIDDILALEMVNEHLASIGASTQDTSNADTCEVDPTDGPTDDASNDTSKDVKSDDNVSNDDAKTPSNDDTSSEDTPSEDASTDTSNDVEESGTAKDEGNAKDADTTADDVASVDKGVIDNIKAELKLANAQNVDLMDRLKRVQAERVADLKITLDITDGKSRDEMISELVKKSDDYITDTIAELEGKLNSRSESDGKEVAESKQIVSNKDNADGSKKITDEDSKRVIKTINRAKNRMDLLTQYHQTSD